VTVIGTILRGAERRSLDQPESWLWDAFGGTSTYSGKSVNAKGALGLVPVWAAVNLLAGSVGQLPMRVYRGQGREKELATNTPQWELLHEKPNDEQATDVFFENLTGHLNLRGNAYLEKDKGRAGVGALWPIDPSKVEVEREKAAPYRKRFRVAGDNRWVGEETILHIPGFGTDGLAGLSPIEICRQTLGIAMAREEYEGRFYANDSTPNGVLSVDGELTEGASTRLQAQWDALHSGANRHRTAVLEAGASWQSVGMSMRDAQFIENARFSTNQVARIFQVPPEMIGGDRESSMTYSTVQGQSIHFVVFSLQRWLIRIERSLWRHEDLFPDRQTYPKFSVEGLLRGDSTERAAFYASALEHKWLSVEEVRELEDRGPMLEGDTILEQPGTAPPPDTNGGARADLKALAEFARARRDRAYSGTVGT
jgi:HK97 family phage portal protein